MPAQSKALVWVRRMGVWGFVFFTVKGLLWLIVPGVLVAWAAMRDGGEPISADGPHAITEPQPAQTQSEPDNE